MTALTIILSFYILLFSSVSFSRDWKRIQIPNAVCGDGRPYSVFVDRKASQKLLIEFMGGGACWSYDTCFSWGLRTWAHPIPELPAYSHLTRETANHRWANQSAVYFPYCTGDVFAANHSNQYENKKVYHQGYKNIELTLDYLAKQKLLEFNQLQEVTVWGASAGAIGALVHLKNIENYIPQANKFAIIDSAGLHFGPTFWNKFTPELNRDYQNTFAKLGLNYDLNNGFLAPHMGPVFENLKNWKLGFLQSTKDEVMSDVFGEISPEEHKKLLLSKEGLPEVVKNYPHVKMWVNDSRMHTFLLLKATTYFEDQQSKSAMQFVNSLFE